MRSFQKSISFGNTWCQSTELSEHTPLVSRSFFFVSTFPFLWCQWPREWYWTAVWNICYPLQTYYYYHYRYYHYLSLQTCNPAQHFLHCSILFSPEVKVILLCSLMDHFLQWGIYKIVQCCVGGWGPNYWTSPFNNRGEWKWTFPYTEETSSWSPGRCSTSSPRPWSLWGPPPWWWCSWEQLPRPRQSRAEQGHKVDGCDNIFLYTSNLILSEFRIGLSPWWLTTI